MCAIVTACGVGDGGRADVWRFHGGVGLNVGYADNPAFVSTRNPSYDPNAPVCDPSDPSYDPSAPVCQQTTSSEERRGSRSGSLSLNGGISGTWATSSFRATYSPSLYYYRRFSGLDTAGHRLASDWRHDYSPRTRLSLSELLTYTPEQDVDPNRLSSNSVIVQRTRTTISNFRGELVFEKTHKTTLTWTFRYNERAFSSNDYIDTGEQEAGMEYRRALGRFSSFNAGYDFGLFNYKGRFPGADHHNAHVGYGMTLGPAFNAGVGVGYNVLVPDDPNQKTSDGVFTNASVGFHGGPVRGNLGYSRGIRQGGAIFAASRAANSFGNVRWEVTRDLSAEMMATYNVNQRISGSTGAARADETVRSFNGRASLIYALSPAWSLTASYTHYRQSRPPSVTLIPDVRSNRYWLGVSWSYR